MSTQTEHLKDRNYLGDGVHVGHDGYHVVLWLEWPGAYGTNAIALEPAVLALLQEYAARLRAEVDE